MLRRLDVQAGALAGALALLWLLLWPRTPDLAAQSYRVGLWQHWGYLLWDNGWYAGHHVPGYSLLFPPLGALLGMRVAGALVATAAAVLFAKLAERHFEPAPRAGVLLFAAATASDLAIGRLTYALGAALGLAALLALQRRRPAVAGGLAALCAAATPLAGLFLGLCAAALWLGGRRREALWLGLPAVVLAFALAGLFPEGGREPFGFRAFVAALVLSLAWTRQLGSEQRTLRIGGALYVVAVVLAFALDTPMGGNISRLGAVAMLPLLFCSTGPVRGRSTVLLAAALFAWQWNAPALELPKGISEPLTRASTYVELKRFLSAHHAQRIEVPFTRSHWESAFLPPAFPLARGWEKQLDTRYNELFFHRPLAPATYHSWLRSLGVRYVALPDSSPDPSSRDEVALLRRGAPFLRPVWGKGHWRVFELSDPLPLAQGATLSALHEDGFVLRFALPGRAVARVRFSRWFHAPGACVSRAPGGWTAVRAKHPGLVRVKADGGGLCGG